MFTSVQLSCSVVFESLRPHGLQHARLPCPSCLHTPTHILTTIESKTHTTEQILSVSGILWTSFHDNKKISNNTLELILPSNKSTPS